MLVKYLSDRRIKCFGLQSKDVVKQLLDVDKFFVGGIYLGTIASVFSLQVHVSE